MNWKEASYIIRIVRVVISRNGQGDGNRFPPLAESDWVTGDETRLINIVLNGLRVK